MFWAGGVFESRLVQLEVTFDFDKDDNRVLPWQMFYSLGSVEVCGLVS